MAVDGISMACAVIRGTSLRLSDDE